MRPARSLPAAGAIALALTMVVPAVRTASATVPSGSPAPCVNPVASWSLDQRLNQLLMVSGQFANLAASAPEASAGVGGFVLFGQPPAGSGPALQSGISALAADATSAGQLVPWMSTDEEGGNIARLANVIGTLPTPRQMASQWTPSQTQAALYAHGLAMRSLGMTMDLAPVLDTAPVTDTIAGENNRSFSENGWVAAAYGLAYSNGLRSAGIVPVVKHFPGLGHATANTDLATASDPSLLTLEGDDLIPFEQAFAAGLPVVMVGHPIVPGLTGGLPASLSPASYHFLRGNLQFNGVALTDSLDAAAVSNAGYSETSAAVAAIEAGADMVMIDAWLWQATLTALRQAVSAGALSPATLDAAVTRIVATKGLQFCPTAWSSLGGILVGGPAVASMSSGRLDLFVRGADNALWHRWWNGNAWSGWESLGGQLAGDPSAVAWGPNRLDVFVRGADDGLWHKWWDGTAWRGWEPLGGVLASAPEVASWASNRLDVFVRGTDNALWHRWWDGGAWRGWESLHGNLASAPGAVSWGPNRIDVFTTGTNSALQHLWWDGAGWHGWESLGGILTSGPEAASWGSDRIDVYALGGGSILYHRAWNGLAWNPWAAVDGQFWTADPGAVARLPGAIDLFERGADGGAWVRETDGA